MRDTIDLQPPLFDRWFVFAVLALALFGLLMVASASVVIAAHQFHHPFHYFYRQLLYLILGIMIGGIVVQFDLKFWENTGMILMAGVMLLLALVLLPGIGRVVNGSARWIGITSSLGIEVSELAKLTTVIYLAGYLVRHHAELKSNLSAFLKPIGLFSVVAILLLKEPDFGSTVVIMATALGMLFLAGINLRYFLLLIITASTALGILALAAPYRLARLTTFLDPWASAYGTGYQLTQSLIAFGRGGWFGLGLGQGIQKLFYLPEAHTDFLFAVIAEELGFFGILVMTILFTLFVARIFILGRRAQLLKRHFAGYIAYGIGFWMALQFAVSIGVNCGILPTKGLTLPLVSYGGSSMLVTCIAIALLLRIDHENRAAAP
ncbi:MAG: putative lipid II flippase FtsW [Gammaproteobacteria bacterium]|nr:putative lipid II flippase FtsW [Gammaproteobacteria bacterium]